MAYETLNFERESGMVVVTLNRPNQMNSINTAMQKDLKDLLNEIENDSSIRVVVITGGEKCFCTGRDIKEVFPPGVRPPSSRNYFKRIEDLDRPTIAAVSGYCLGGGLELALCCDLRIASDTARFGLAEIKVGRVPGAGGMQRLPRLIGITKAKEMLYTGNPIDAEEAHRVGLVNKVVPVASLMDESRSMAQTLLDRPSHALKIAKRCVNEGMQLDLPSALRFDVAIAASEMASPEAQANLEEGTAAFREKRKPVWR
ncbi:MAG: enoyl-CoA hydratase/isomerase family protein [Syntrophales bacterium]|nr:enoyl-CoA hydratase/isomerase family protein [Syntrophales bacterium]